jgi:hypothetical protein
MIRRHTGTRPIRSRPPFAAGVAVLILGLALMPLLAACSREEKKPATAEDWGEKPGGRWHKGDWMEVPPEVEASLTEEQRAEFQRLLSIGYVSGSDPVPANTGVVVYDGSKAWNGVNFYTSGHFPGATLMDMSGKVLHTWEYKFLDAWNKFPGSERPSTIKTGGFWRHAHLFPNGDVIAIFDWLGIIKVDRHSNLMWAQFGGFHHDLDLLPDGRIVTLLRKARIVPRIHPELPILEDFIVILDPDGNEVRRFSVLEALENSEYSSLLANMAESGDILHTNTVEVLDGRLANKIPAFRAGNVLITVRQLGIIAVVDLDREVVVWGFDGHWRMPHKATVLDNGHILIFDNRGNGGYSQLVEFDPVTAVGTWIYRGPEPKDFYSKECGSCKRLPNGNTLISETDRGKAFEVTPEGEIVWKYINPMRAGDNLEFVASVFDMIRLPRDFPLESLGQN